MKVAGILFVCGLLLGMSASVSAEKPNQNGYSNTTWICKYVNDCGTTSDEQSLYGGTIKTSTLGGSIRVDVTLGALQDNQLSDKVDHWDPSSGFVNPCVEGLEILLDQLAHDRPGQSIIVQITGDAPIGCPSP